MNRWIAALLTAVTLASAVLQLGAPDARAASIPTVTTVTGPAQAVDVPDLVTVTVQISPAPQPLDGFIPAVNVYVDGSLRPETIAADGTAVASLSLTAGRHDVYAAFDGFNGYDASQSSTISIEVGSATTTVLTSSREPALNTQDVTYTATVTGKNGYPQPADPPVGGTLTITDTTTSSVLGTLAVTATARTLTITRKLTVGSHALRAAYTGAGLYRASSARLTETIQADRVVDAAGVTSTPATFYPVIDSYKDTLSIRGSRREPISVAIRIYSVSTGKLVRGGSVVLGSGAYAWAWNGRSTSGVLQPAGSYRIVQTLTDTAANRLAITTTAVISLKRLYWHTATITKYGGAYSIKGDPGNGYVSRTASGYYRGVKLSSGRSWVAISYPFTIPSATVYKTVTFKVLGRSPNGTRATIAIWNPGWGSYQYVESYSQARLVGPGYRWWATSGPGSALHSGRTARAEVFLEYGPGGKVFDVAKVSLVVKYALLR
ncbi:MAG TPA: hypothetical protein VFY18_15095 [Candidatus Limnocylindrales bacterium]|nr:hypothetical protein [Candidatus Limnocylindrales bacterium]